MKFHNPFTITKDTSPYLYLTNSSGLYINEYDEPGVDRGAEIPINVGANDDYSLMALQVWIKGPSQFCTSAPVFEIIGQSFSAQFIMTPESSGRRGRITSVYADVEYFQNGVPVTYPILYPDEWQAININFTDPPSFSNFTGRLILRPGFSFDNISEYAYENPLTILSTYEYVPWADVATGTWADLELLGSWLDAVAVFSQAKESLSGNYIYNDLVGTSIFVVEDFTSINVFSNGSDTFTDVSWQTLERPAV